jgi:hypothetical protein
MKQRSDSRGGFRVDLDYGPTATLVHSFEPTGEATGGDLQNIEQAYVSYLAPAGAGLQLDFGKFVTPAGYEVIETKDNWNYSRSLLFALAVPYYHLGLRASYCRPTRLRSPGIWSMAGTTPSTTTPARRSSGRSRSSRPAPSPSSKTTSAGRSRRRPTTASATCRTRI